MGYSLSIPDEEEIECLKEDTVKKDIISKSNFKMSLAASEAKKETSVTKIDSTKETKPAIAGLPMDEAWMIDDVGNMDSASEEESEQKREVSVVEEPEQRKEVSAVPLEKKPETPKETKPLIAGLPMDDASEAWMIDDVGTMDSDSEEESEQKKDVSLVPVEKRVSVVEEPEQRKEVSAVPL